MPRKIISTRNNPLAYSRLSTNIRSQAGMTNIMGRKRSAASFEASTEKNETTKKSKKSKSTKVVRKKRRIVAAKLDLSLTDLPPHFINSVISHLSLAEQTILRSVCKYTHDEIDAYWRMRQSINTSDLKNWFPELRSSQNWKFESLFSLRAELTAIFNLLKLGNLKRLSLEGIKSVRWPTLVEIIEKGTERKALETLKNIRELDIRKCHISHKDLQAARQMLPMVDTLIVDKHFYVPPSLCRLSNSIRNKKFEVSRHRHLIGKRSNSSCVLQTVEDADEKIVWYLKSTFNNVHNIIIDCS